ncbi:ribosomal protein L17 [Amylocarpus encephaloides]|uniref:Large ribosomal subunit protein bL17m n=1 Tax=Amylocarpus encephaloides TaxID=45428 RepID=A0A9P7YJ44_9HELO|nr:ribosomal protein L17 [Amylocarpus encephaloides]
MAGGRMKYRHLNRSSAHRQALLRNLVSSLIQHEQISTTWPKAKEAQRMAEKLITLGKKNTEASKRKAFAMLYQPHELTPKVFGALRERYAERPGGYTRVLRIEPLKPDMAPSAILELVDGPKDMRFAMLARTVHRERNDSRNLNQAKKRWIKKERVAGRDATGEQWTEVLESENGVEETRDIIPLQKLTRDNVKKATRYRPGGVSALESMVSKMSSLEVGERNNAESDERRWGGRV